MISNNLIKSNSIMHNAHYLWILTLTYAMVIVLSNWFDPRLIHIFTFDTDAGTLIFPFTFLLSDSITEVYGFKYARQAIWCGLFFNIIFIVYGQIIIHLPSPNYPTHNDMFDTLLSINNRIIFASGFSYIISESLNSIIMATLKIKMSGRYLSIRFLLSTMIASCLDSWVFGLCAFYGTLKSRDLLSLILSMWFVKVAIEVIGMPLSVYLTNKLKEREKLDIYDTNMDFNMFSLETNYMENDNKYQS